MKSKSHHLKESSDEDLLLKSGRGERLAFELLYERYRKKLQWFAKGFLQSEAKAEDVVQEVFIKIIEQPHLFDRTKKFSTWIYTITSNQCKNVIRNEHNRLRIISENGSDAEHSEINMVHDKRIMRDRISKAVETLSEKEQAVFSMRFNEEMNIREIANLLAIPEGTVKSTIFHLLKKIAKQLKDLEYETKR